MRDWNALCNALESKYLEEELTTPVTAPHRPIMPKVLSETRISSYSFPGIELPAFVHENLERNVEVAIKRWIPNVEVPITEELLEAVKVLFSELLLACFSFEKALDEASTTIERNRMENEEWALKRAVTSALREIGYIIVEPASKEISNDLLIEEGPTQMESRGP